MRRMLALIVIVVVLAGGLAAAPARLAAGKQIQSGIGVDVTASDLNGDDANAIYGSLANALATAAQLRPDAWGCVAAPGHNPFETNVSVFATVTQDTDTLAYTIKVSLGVFGQGVQVGAPFIVQQSDIGPLNPASLQLATYAEASLNDLTAAFTPCKAKLELHAKTVVSAEDVSVTYAYDTPDSDADTFTIGADGSFDATVPITLAVSEAVPDCSDSFQVANPRLKLSGGLSDDGQSLQIKDATAQLDDITGSITCGDGDDSVTCTLDANATPPVVCPDGSSSGGPLLTQGAALELASNEIDLPLDNGASLTIPEPAALKILPSVSVSWSGTLALDYGNGGSGSNIPSDQQPPAPAATPPPVAPPPSGPPAASTPTPAPED